jgi:hypothetical protein
LTSFDKCCQDAKDISIRLIVSKNELSLFLPLQEQWKRKFDLQVVDLQTILLHEEGLQINEDELLNEVGKFNFQSIKKIYGVKYFDHDVALVLDSEAILVRRFEFSRVFQDFMNEKFIIYSKHGVCEFQSKVTKNCLKLLDESFIDKWMFEYQYWFFEKHHVNNLFKTVFNATKRTIFENLKLYSPIFEFNLYALYLYKFHNKEYKFIDSEVLLKESLGSLQFDIYKAKIQSYNTTLFEYFSWALTEDNFSGFERIFKNLSMKFFKYDDRHQVPENISTQIKFIQRNENIFMLPCRVVTRKFFLNGEIIDINHRLDGFSAPYLKRLVRLFNIFFNTIFNKSGK